MAIGRTIGGVYREMSKALKDLPQRLQWGDRLDARYYLAYRLSLLRGQRVLDVGCGPGVLLGVLDQSNKCYGVDPDPQATKYARVKAPKAIITNDLWNAKEREVYDVIVLASMLDREDTYRFIPNAARALKRGGKLFLLNANRSYRGYRHLTDMTDYQGLDSMLKPYFQYEIKGWNPFPQYPYFIPSRILASVPGWLRLLEILCERGVARKTSKFLYVEAVKK